MASRSLALLLAVSLLFTSPAAAGDAEDVKAAFAAYKNAVMTGDGSAAAARVTKGTFAYYAEMRDNALYGTEAELKELPSVDLMQALMLRQRIEAKKLQGLSGRDLVVLAVDEGWIGKKSAAGVDVGEVTRNGDAASAGIVANGAAGPASFSFDFLREDGDWKLDLVSLLLLTGSAFDMMAEAQGVPVDEFVLRLLALSSGETPGPEIWQPPLQRPSGD